MRPKLEVLDGGNVSEKQDTKSMGEAYKRAKAALVDRRDKLKQELRDVEELLGFRPESDDDDERDDDREALEVIMPRPGTIQGRVYEMIGLKPGVQFEAIEKGLKLGKVQVASALTTMLKHGALRVTGRRGAYHYHAVK